jgi:hypothetical protein
LVLIIIKVLTLTTNAVNKKCFCENCDECWNSFRANFEQIIICWDSNIESSEGVALYTYSDLALYVCKYKKYRWGERSLLLNVNAYFIKRFRRLICTWSFISSWSSDLVQELTDSFRANYSFPICTEIHKTYKQSYSVWNSGILSDAARS